MDSKERSGNHDPISRYDFRLLSLCEKQNWDITAVVIGSIGSISLIRSAGFRSELTMLVFTALAHICTTYEHWIPLSVTVVCFHK